jgi:hypothetical protein
LKALYKNDDGKLTEEEMRPDLEGMRGGRGGEGGRGRGGAGGRGGEGGRGGRGGRGGEGGEGGRGGAGGRGRGGDGGRGGDARGGAAMIQRIMGYDKDDDGKVSKTELPERMQAMFGRVDANSDDFLDKAELEKMASRMENRGGGSGAGGRDDKNRGAGTRPNRPPNENKDDDREGDDEDRD